MSQAHSRPALPSPQEIAALPPDGGPGWNRLVFTRSPYLLQHAANPVDWWPWCPEAFERARAEDKPIFLSIGYSTCHWCHVMEHESFEDQQVADLLNKHMIAIKVDREERPDIDQVYMTVTQAMTGQGGWPMTVVMTPDKKPFFAGTYYPKYGNPYRPGMVELVPALSQAWKDQREKVLDSAAQITESISGLAKGTPGNLPGAEAFEDFLEIMTDQYDDEYGGFGRGRNKFPIPHNLSLLLRVHARTGKAPALDMATKTLESMRRGGIFDHVGFGFHRYSTDREWLLPHFEKMLYDQAMLLVAYSEGFAKTRNKQFACTAREIIAYVTRDMTAPEGGFYSAEDADSEGVEGKFYVWTPKEIAKVLGPDDAKLWCDVFQIKADGNFHDEATGEQTGENIPHLRSAIPAEHAERIEQCRARLFAHREGRVHPFKDDKILADWNGLMIAGLAIAGRLLPDEKATAAAERAAEFVLANLRDANGRLIKCWRAGSAAGDGQLEDYAFLAWGLVELYETTFDPRWLRESLALVAVLNKHFADTERGGYFQVADDAEQLLVRAKDAYDGAIPSGNGAAAWVLTRLARMTGNADLERDARRTMEAFGETLAKAPTAHAQMLIGLDLLVGPSREVVLVGTPGDEDFEALRSEVHLALGARTVVLHQSEGIAGIAPFTTDMKKVDGKAAAYVCENFACKRPVTTANELRALLESE